MRRLSIAALLGAALLLACLAGCLGDDPDPTAGPAGTPLPDLQPVRGHRPEATFGPNISLEVVYSEMWSGAYGSPEAMHSDEGFGNRTFPLPPNANRIQATFQKQETTNETLTLRLVRNGTVLKETSGSAPLAVVTLEATPPARLEPAAVGPDLELVDPDVAVRRDQVPEVLAALLEPRDLVGVRAPRRDRVREVAPEGLGLLDRADDPARVRAERDPDLADGLRAEREEDVVEVVGRPASPRRRRWCRPRSRTGPRRTGSGSRRPCGRSPA